MTFCLYMILKEVKETPRNVVLAVPLILLCAIIDVKILQGLLS